MEIDSFKLLIEGNLLHIKKHVDFYLEENEIEVMDNGNVYGFVHNSKRELLDF